MNDTYATLHNLIHTKTQLHEFISQIDQLKDSLYSKKNPIENEIVSIFSVEKKEKLLNTAQVLQVNINDSLLFGNMLENIKLYLLSLPIVKITLSYEPTEAIVKTMSVWFTSNMKKKFLFDIHIDEHLIGGVVIEYKGFHKDFSVKKIISQLNQ